jgi:hypothetical protein
MTLSSSAILSVLSFVAIVAVGWRYRQYRAHAILVVAVGCFCKPFLSSMTAIPHMP